MKVIADVVKQTLRMLENERSIFRGEYGVDKLELYIIIINFFNYRVNATFYQIY